MTVTNAAVWFVQYMEMHQHEKSDATYRFHECDLCCKLYRQLLASVAAYHAKMHEKDSANYEEKVLEIPFALS